MRKDEEFVNNRDVVDDNNVGRLERKTTYNHHAVDSNNKIELRLCVHVCQKSNTFSNSHSVAK